MGTEIVDDRSRAKLILPSIRILQCHVRESPGAASKAGIVSGHSSNDGSSGKKNIVEVLRRTTTWHYVAVMIRQ